MNNYARLLMVVATVLALCVPALAQHVVYKWVDREGIVHFSDEPPSSSEAVSIEKMILPDSPAPPPTPPQSVSTPSDALEEARETSIAPSNRQSTPKADSGFDSLSQEELDRRCEAEREAKIAPLREQEIEKCIHEQRKDPDYCRRFYADYGAGGRTVHGTIRPRMFHDLPVCLEAEKRRHGG